MATAGVRRYRWDGIPPEPVTDVISRKIITGERAMLAEVTLARGAVVPKHEHESEQTSWVFTGALRFDINGEIIDLRPGDVLVIPSGVPHQATALEDTVEVDIFSPIRQDWLDKTDDYFRR